MTFKGTPGNQYPQPRSEKVADKKTRKWLKFSLYFLTASILLTSVYTGYEFVQTHDFKSPIVIKFQNPTPRKVIIIKSPVGKKTSLIQQAYAEEIKPYSIREDIKEVFGVHADDAFKVLGCENSALNPNAVNTAGNIPSGSRDIGVFQINEHWQDVNGKFLFDPAINIRIAYKIFIDNGSFERWTCGRNLGL